LSKSRPRGKQTGAEPKRNAPRGSVLRRPWVAPAALVLLTALVYARSLLVPVHDWDDYVYIFRDTRLDHLSPANIIRIMTEPFFANFHPLTTLTYAFDRAVWGSWAPGFHITQLAFYLGGVLGLYFLFDRLLAWRAGALAAAAIYATHTIHVESVAWLASRKDVVCLFFYALALGSYVRYAGSSSFRPGAYAATFLLSAAAMLSKGYAVILPGAFLAYDLCFTERMTRKRILDKVPFLLLAAVTVVLTANAQDRDSALVQAGPPMATRVALLCKIFALYVGRSLLPIRLSAFYSVGGESAEGPIVLLGVLLAIGLLLCFFSLRRKNPAAAFGIAIFLLPLATVMNFFFTLRIWMTDRYLFFPTIGSSLALVALAAPLFRSGRADQRAPAGGASIRGWLAAAAIVMICLYSTLTFARIGVWTSSVSLWSDVLRKDLDLPGSGPVTADQLKGSSKIRLVANGPLMGLVHAYLWTGNNEEAGKVAALVGQTAGAGADDSELALAQKDLDAGRPADALRRLTPIAEGKTWIAPLATIWIGVAQKQMGNEAASRQAIRDGIERYHKSGQPATDGLLHVGTAAFSHGDYRQAAEWYGLALQESPKEAKAAFHLGRALEEEGDVPKAMELYKRIVAGDLTILPDAQFTLLDVYLQMAVASERIGRRQEAVGYFEEVLRRSPNHPKREAILAKIKALQAPQN
jgi:protein O-mannosyl-transferase